MSVLFAEIARGHERAYRDAIHGEGRGGVPDALRLRPGLAAALKEARSARYPLIVSRLDRYSFAPIVNPGACLHERPGGTVAR